MRVRASLGLVALAFAVTGCQLVFGLDDFSEGGPSPSTSGSGGQGTGGGATTSSTATTTGLGGGADCACLDPIWTPVTLVAQGDPAVDTLPTGCPTAGDVLNLFAEPPTVQCAGCQCSASCTSPAVTCFSDTACTQGAKTMTPPPGACFDGGATFHGCKLDAAPTVTACNVSGGDPAAVYRFAQYSSFCADDTCGACEPAGAEQACVVASGNIPVCPAGLDERIPLFASGEASCPTCGCDASCNAPYEIKSDLDAFCIAGGNDIPSTSCTSLGNRRYLVSHDGSASCTTGDGATHAGTFTVGDPYTVCCRQALAPPG